jgi:hypothetical protein
MYGYQCEYCDGTVEERIMTEDFRHKGELVILHKMCLSVFAIAVKHATITRRCLNSWNILPKRRANSPRCRFPLVNFNGVKATGCDDARQRLGKPISKRIKCPYFNALILDNQAA